MSLTTNVTNDRQASLSPREAGGLILSQMAGVLDATDLHDPEDVRYGFIITGFAPPECVRPAAFETDIALPALSLLRHHITKFSSNELFHCKITGCTPFDPMPVHTAQRWAEASVVLTNSVRPFRSSFDDTSQFVSFCISITRTPKDPKRCDYGEGCGIPHEISVPSEFLRTLDPGVVGVRLPRHSRRPRRIQQTRPFLSCCCTTHQPQTSCVLESAFLTKHAPDPR